MSRDFREQVEPRVLSTDYYQRGHFTVAIVETEWRDDAGGPAAEGKQLDALVDLIRREG